MRLWGRKTEPAKSNVPDDGELVAYLDGQLDPARQEQISELLRSSWRLRARLAQVERDIETIVRSIPAEPPGGFPEFDDVWKPQLDPPEMVSGVTLGSRRPLGSPWLLGRLATGSVAIGLMVLLIVYVSSPPVISAKELVALADRAEQKRRRVELPVVRQKFEISRKGPAGEGSATWELWNAVQNDSIRERLAPVTEDADAGRSSSREAVLGLYEELTEIYRANHIDYRQPLSMAAYRQWRDLAEPEEEVVRETLPGGVDGLALKAVSTKPRFEPKAIRQTELVFRTGDFLPVMQRLKVQTDVGIAEYQVVVKDYEVLELASLGREFFAPSVMEQAAPTQTHFAPPEVRDPPAALPVRRADLLAAAAEAHFVLHRMEACRTDAVAVVPESTAVVIRGLTQSPSRRDELLAAAAQVPHVSVNIEVGSAGDARTQPEDKRQEGASSFLAQLAKGDDAGPATDQVAFTSAVVSSIGTVRAHNAALRRLLAAYSPDDVDQLPIASRNLLQEIIGDHLSVIQGSLEQLEVLMEPALAHITVTPGTEPSMVVEPVSSWGDLNALAQDVDDSNGLLHTLFLGGVPLPTLEQSAERLLSRLPHVCDRIERARTAVSQAAWTASTVAVAETPRNP